MKKIFIFLAALACNYSFSQYKFVLEGKVQDSTKKKIYLEIRDDYSLNEYVKIDSCIIQKGSFQFSGELNKKSEIANLFFIDESKIRSDPDKFRFILDNGINVINVDFPKVHSTSLFSNAKRPVSVSNDLYNKLNYLYENYFEKYASNVKTWDPKKPEEISMVKMLDNPEITVKLRKEQLQIVKNYSNSFYSLIFLYESLHYRPYIKSPSLLVEIFNNLNESIKNTPLGNEFIKECLHIMKVEKETSTQHQVPIFKIKTDKEDTFTNASLLGKPYIIAFSATWCTPCKKMEPKLKSFYNNYKDKGLEVIYFNFDDNDKKWKEHIFKNQLDWINVSDGLKAGSSPIIKQFNIIGIPQYIVVDKNGTIIYNSTDPNDSNFLMLESYILKAIQ